MVLLLALALSGCAEERVMTSLDTRASGLTLEHGGGEKELWSIVQNNDVINTWVLLSHPYFPDMQSKGVKTAFDEIAARTRKEIEGIGDPIINEGIILCLLDKF